MTELEAERLVELVGEEAPEIEATIAHVRRNARGYQVKLLLKRERRIQTAYSPQDWPSIKESWEWFLYGEEEMETVK